MDPFSALAIAAAVVAVIYIAGRRNPITKCGRCVNGVIRSWVLPWRVRPCPRCGRTGEIRARFGRK